MTPWLDDGDVQLYHGDVVDTLRSLPAGIVQTVVTSPPYWRLRDYGTGEWSGGAADCAHRLGGNTGRHRDICGRCGARRVDQQLGLEAIPQLYVERLVTVFREVRRVLADTGTVWCNLGDSFLPGKQLAGIPWRVAFALQADGWILRSDIVWSKPNPMPESVSDRPTKAHEYLFLLTKRTRYYWDADAIREQGDMVEKWPGHLQRYRDLGGSVSPKHAANGDRKDGAGRRLESAYSGMRNRRSVWTIATEPFPEAHFATYPQELVRPCILAGTSERGECVECGAPWQREVEREVNGTPRNATSYADAHGPDGRDHQRASLRVETTGWRSSCIHGAPGFDAPTRPQTVLDPFIGSGTTALVARKHGRRCIGIDLNAEYLDIAARRLQQLSLFAEPA